jgi:signal transduction histidine kinase
MGIKLWAVVLTFLTLALVAIAEANPRAPNTILFISSGSADRTYILEKSLEETWKKRDPGALILEFRLAGYSLPVSARAYGLAAQELADRLTGRNLRIIVTDGDPSTDLAVPLRNEYFRDVPVLCMGATDSARIRYAKESRVYQFSNHNYADESIKMGMTFFPKAKRAVIIVRVGTEVKAYTDYVAELRKTYAGLEIHAVMNPDMFSVDAELRSSSEPTVIALLSPGWNDAQGRLLSGKALISALESEYGMPVVSFVPELLGEGLVGGFGVSAKNLGKKTAETGLAIVLDGIVPEAWLSIHDIASPFVDYQALIRFGSSPNLVPRGAEIVNLPESVWIRYRNLFVAAFAVLLAAVAVLFFILVSRRRERRFLVKANATLEEKIAERTGELRSTNEELSASNQSLTLMMRRTEAMQENVLRHEREVTLGRLTTGIAHELNTPLNAIRSANESVREVALGGEDGIGAMLSALDGKQRELFLRYARRVIEGAAGSRPDTSPAAGSADALESRLAALPCANAASVAADLRDAGLDGLDDRELAEFAADPAGAAAKALYRLSVIGRSTSIVDTAVGQAVEVLKVIREYLTEYRAEGEKVLLRPSIERALLLFKNRLSRGISIRTEFAADPCVRGNETVLLRIWVHLIQNALEAMSEGGVLTVSLEREDGFAIVRFDDEGTGVSPAIAADLFTPFVTTKPPAEGMGLGLAYCRKAAEALHGGITFSGKEKGTVFTVRLPVEEAE